MPVPAEVAAELVSLAQEVLAEGTESGPLAPAGEVSAPARALAEEASRRLDRGPGFVVLRGFPVTEPPQVVETAYQIFGRLLGRPVSQTRDGEFLARVEDRGADISRPTQRGHRSASDLAFHADRTDVIGLLCVRSAAEGGLSRLVSSRILHDTIQAERPDLLAELYGCLPNDQRGEERPGTPGWCPLPVFSREGGDFAARYLRRFIEDSQRHPDAPRLTVRQRESMDLLDEILERPGVCLGMELHPGDLQFIDNYRLLHARTAFRDTAGEGAGRLLLRLWLAVPYSPALPAEYAALVGDTAAGAYRGGVWPSGEFPARVDLGAGE
ncbi:hypothetical protein N566_04785 [Streptomycetaceae bacterium MP113-05]|nr:hypothetical protein N566_04785 [Streptomycetaceae bacterium MP113-05]